MSIQSKMSVMKALDFLISGHVLRLFWPDPYEANTRECVRILDLQVHPGELWVSKQWVHIVLEASNSAGAKGDVPKICGFVHPLHPC